jgi:hypothetical protein
MLSFFSGMIYLATNIFFFTEAFSYAFEDICHHGTDCFIGEFDANIQWVTFLLSIATFYLQLTLM